MSYTYSNRPAVTRAKAPKQLQGSEPKQYGGINRTPAATNDQRQDAVDDQERSLEVRTGYMVMPPNEKRRQQIQQQAEKETRAYEKFKQQNKLGHVSHVGTVGGGPLQTTESEARRKAAATVGTRSRVQRQLKSDQDKQAKQLQENKEIQKKKEEQRRKSELNVSKDQERQARLREEHRRKNAEFFGYNETGS